MKSFRTVPETCLLAGLIALSLSSTSTRLYAQAEPESTVQRTAVAYDPAREVTFNAIVQEVVAEHAAHSPAGLHLLVASSKGPVDAHLGPYVSEDTRKALYAREAVQLVGVMDHIHGKDYLLARQLIFAGRLVTIRSEHGFLLLPHSARAARAVPDKPLQHDVNGAAR